MIKAMSNIRKSEAGFTLIELMIVMVVLGILAGIVIFATGGFSSSANTATTGANNRICDTAEAAYLAAPTPKPAWATFFSGSPPSECPTNP